MTQNRSIMAKGIQTLYLLFISGFCYLTLGSSDFQLIPLLKTYQDAKSHCKEMYTDLATVHNATDMKDLITLVSNNSSRAWIGLETGDVWMWHWSKPNQKQDFFKWRAGESQEKKDACAAMDTHGDWFVSNCGAKRSFICHGNGDTSGHIFVAGTKSWRDAQSHCRGLLSDLVSIHSSEENEAVRNVSVSNSAWIGLFRDPWKWSDGSTSSFRNWKPLQPNYLKGQNCTAAIFKDGRWNDLKCTGKRNFVCHGAKKSIVTTTNQTSTHDILTTAQLPTNLTTPHNSSHNVITFHFTVVTSSQEPNTSSLTPKEATTASKLTTTTTVTITSTIATTVTTTPTGTTTNGTTTDPVPFVNPTEISSATTEMSTMTATHATPTTTGQISALTTLTTSSQSSTQSSTRMPPDNNQDLTSGNLILIQENMTWFEAMSYCREHHVDLVHITTGDIQKKVAEKARNATSAYVWLGLRYTCNFDFWFWTSSATGCYQNWAPGEGSEVKYDCGVTGAIQATGGQQWVVLPEAEKLNFICHACAG